MSLVLEIVEGPGAGRQIALDASVVVGRGPDAGLALDDDLRVSRAHARIVPTPDGATVEDLGSANGTFVNRAAVTATAALRPGDDLLLGTTVLELRAAAQPSAVRTVPAALAAPHRPPAYVPDQALSADTGRLDTFLDARTKARARLAPVAIFVLVVFVLLIYLAAK